MSKLLKYFKKYILYFLSILALLYLQAQCDLALPKYTAGILNDIAASKAGMQTKSIFQTGGIMLGISLLGMAAAFSVAFLSARLSAALAMDMRSDVFKRVVSFSTAEFEKFSTASLITRSTNDIQQVAMVVVMLMRSVFYAPIMGIGAIRNVLQTNTSMAWIIAMAVGVLLILITSMLLLTLPRFKMLQKLVDRLNLITREILSGLPVIRAFATEGYEEKRFEKANVDLTKTSLFVNRVMSFMMPAIMIIMNGTSILIEWKSASGINAGTMEAGDMIAFIQYTMQIITSFLMISMMSISLPRASVSVKRIAEVLSTETTIDNPENPKPFNEELKGVVEFKNVSFRYPGAEEDVLSDISFIAKPGQTVAFIGSTGSGKTTLVNLIPRFYDVTGGQILVDGVDVREASLYELRQKLGYVPQKGVLFWGTIESNIKYGAPDISQDQMQKAARIAQAESFISEKENTYQSEIAQGGTNVSGGQRQRLAIARAIAKNPEIYIFDDSFSALDFKTDAALRKALREEIANSTVLIVAQRINTIMHADQIIVLDEGKIVGKGTHEELLENCEVYKQIALSQLAKEELHA